jgi:hypothetical protein
MVGTEEGIKATPKSSKDKNRHKSGNDNFRRDLRKDPKAEIKKTPTGVLLPR